MGFTRNAQGWTDVTPSVDSRIMYVSTSIGGAGNVYNKDDAAIGGNPFAPTGPVTVYSTISAARAQMRDGFPDWVLLKKGDTFSEGFRIDEKRGRSATERAVLGAYSHPGSESTVRPYLQRGSSNGLDANTGGAGANRRYGYFAAFGLFLEAHTRSADGDAGGHGITMGDTARCDGPLLFEDIRVSKFEFGFRAYDKDSPGTGRLNVELRRCVIDNSFEDDGHSSGIYCAGIDSLLVEECVLYHNGWVGARDGSANQFKHNVYMDNESPIGANVGANTRDNTNFFIFRGNISSEASLHGMMVRCGGTIENNLLTHNPVNILLGGGDGKETKMPNGAYGKIISNVSIHPNDMIGTPDNYNGGNLGLEWVNTCKCDGNLIAHIASVNIQNDKPFNVSSTSGLPGNKTIFTTLNGNVVYGVPEAQNVGYGVRLWGAPSSKGSSVVSSTTVLQEENNIWFDSVTVGWPVTGTNQKSEDVTFVQPTRDVASYDAFAGGAGTLANFITQAMANSRDAWNAAYTATAANSWIRAGFGVGEPIPPPDPPPEPQAFKRLRRPGRSRFKVVVG